MVLNDMCANFRNSDPFRGCFFYFIESIFLTSNCIPPASNIFHFVWKCKVCFNCLYLEILILLIEKKHEIIYFLHCAQNCQNGTSWQPPENIKNKQKESSICIGREKILMAMGKPEQERSLDWRNVNGLWHSWSVKDPAKKMTTNFLSHT